MNRKKKKQRKHPRGSTPSVPPPRSNPGWGEEAGVLKTLVEAFGSSVSLEQASEAYKEARGNPNRAAGILAANLLEASADDPSVSSTSSVSTSDSGFGTSSLSGWSEGYLEGDFGVRKGQRGCSKPKKVVAATGTVSTVLGKGYVAASLRKETAKPREFRRWNEEEVDEKVQFLCTLLGEESELSFAVVRDVLCQCAYDVEKALDVLLDLLASSYEQSNKEFRNHADNREDARIFMESIENLNDAASDCTFHSCDIELPENVWSISSHDRNSSVASAVPEIQLLASGRGTGSNVSQDVLECLYKVSKSPQHEPETMNWRKIAKKMNTFGNAYNVSHSTSESPVIPAGGDEYSLLRTEAKVHWDSMKSSYQKAAAAFSKGEKSYAAYLSDQGRKYSGMGQAADEKASQEIFRLRNKNIENLITIDLHGQHVKQAMRLLKIHLLLPSIKRLRVITGSGTHGVGISKLKQAVLRFAEKEGIEWIEENQGTVVFKLDGQRNYNFIDSDSDGD